jgi:hypothetical protein
VLGEALQPLGVASALDVDRLQRGADLGEVLVAQLDVDGA